MEGSYLAQYEEKNTFGKGAFGAAILVQHRKEGKEYICKKIDLNYQDPKEQESAMLEVNLLKNLNHPNIVGYKESFVEQKTLMIIMEFCEVGDMSLHIKRKLKKKEMFTEDEIFNWFIQICLALEYMHGRKVLHRDIKS